MQPPCATQAALDAPTRAKHDSFLKNMSKWDWGHSDFDWCCDDHKAPTYLLYMVTQQGAPKDWDRKSGDWYQAMSTYDGSILDWLRSFF